MGYITGFVIIDACVLATSYVMAGLILSAASE